MKDSTFVSKYLPGSTWINIMNTIGNDIEAIFVKNLSIFAALYFTGLNNKLYLFAFPYIRTTDNFIQVSSRLWRRSRAQMLTQ